MRGYDLQGLLPTSHDSIISPRAPLIIVEVLEAKATRWLLEELVESYLFASSAGLDLLVSNVRIAELQAMLTRRGVPWTWDDGYSFDSPKCILLDLKAPRTLEPWEASAAECIVVGGIMGDHPPRGRTYLLASQVYRYSAKRRLVELQLTIEGAVKVASLVARGIPMDEIEFVYPLEIDIETPLGSARVELPYAYPSYKGKLLAPRWLPELLARGVTWDEETI